VRVLFLLQMRCARGCENNGSKVGLVSNNRAKFRRGSWMLEGNLMEMGQKNRRESRKKTVWE
jgi:hypothetical protein